MKLVAGLGNPGKEYENTRHNAGFIVVDNIEKILEKQNSKNKIKFIKPYTFMNNSGKEVVFYIKNKKNLSELVVIYDDIDIPLGKIKISFNRSSGGHNGVESIIKSVKSQEFIRIRVGICQTTPTGKNRKPKGEDKVIKFLLGEFKKEELAEIKKISKKIAEAVEMIYAESLQKAMTIFN